MLRPTYTLQIASTCESHHRWERELVLPVISGKWRHACRGVRPNTVCRVLIIDDHPIFRHGLSACLRNQGLSVCDAPNSEMAAAKGIKPDILLVGVSKTQGVSREYLDEVRRKFHGVKVLAIINEPDVSLAKRLLHFGVLGCISRRQGIEDFLNAIETVGNEAVYFEKVLANQVLTQFLCSEAGFFFAGKED